MEKQMITLLSVGSILFGFSTNAQTKDPCAPTIRAQPSRLICESKNLRYSIEIETMMSPINERCPMSKHIEVNTATVQTFDFSDHPVSTIKIKNGSFTYELGLPGMSEGKFYSKKYSLDLVRCITPAHGGLSAGN